MIRCDWFWRLLKQWFFTLLTSCFILLGGSFVNWTEKWQMVWLDYSNSVIDSNYEITFLNKWIVLTRLLWVSKTVLAVNWNNIFWFAPNWLPYMSIVWWNNYNRQWYFKRYDVCSLATSWWNYVRPSDCSSVDNIDFEVLKSFFSSITQWDILYYDYSNWSDNQGRWSTSFKVCFSSESIGRSLCFYDWCNYNWVDSCWQNFSWSMNLENLSFSSLSNTLVWYFPWQNWYWWQFNWNSWQWVITWSVNNDMTWSYILDSCTNLDALDYMASWLWMWTTVCYWWLDWFDILSWSDLITVKPNPTQWETVFDIFQHTNNGMNFEQWFNFWKTTYVNRYTSNNLFLDKPTVLYTYFDLLNKYWSQFTARQVQEYCRFIVWNVALTWEYKWSVFSCRDVNKYIEDENTNDEWSSDSAIGVNWNWIWSFWNWSWSLVNWTKSQSNAVVFIQDVFNVLSEAVPTDFSWIWGWFLPWYIIMFLLAIMFFRFISH